MNRLLLALLAIFPLLYPVSVLSPVSADVSEGSEISFGVVGPGQTFAVLVEPKLSTGGKYGLGGSYDRLLASRLPEGWTSNPSKLYSSPMQSDVTVPKDAADGEYMVAFTLWDEAGSEGLGQNVTFSAKVQVSRDVMDMRVEPSFLSVGAGQPARYTITMLNKGIANDIFTVGSSGVSDWEFRRSVYIPSGTSKSLTYEIVGNEESDYKVKLSAQSSSSNRIFSSSEVGLRVNTDLFSDWRAVNRGVLLFPLTEAPLYFFTGLLSNLFS
jgi:hypothetical protein